MPHAPRRIALLLAAVLGLSSIVAGGAAAASADPAGPPVSSPGAIIPTSAYQISQKVVSPDGTRLYLLWGSDEVVTYDTATMTEVARITVKHGPSQLAITPDGRSLVVGNDETYWVSDPVYREAQIVIIDTASNIIRREVSIPGNPRSVTVSPDGSHVVFSYAAHDRQYSYNEARIGVLDLTSDKPFSSVAAPSEWVWATSYSPDLTTAYSIGYGADTPTTLSAIDLTSGTFSQIPVAGMGLVVSTDGHTAVVGGGYQADDRGRIQVIDLPTMTVRGQVDLGRGPAAISLSPDGSTAVMGLDQRSQVVLLDTASMTERRVQLPAGAVLPADSIFLADGRIAVSVGTDSAPQLGTSLYLIDPGTGGIVARVPSAGHELRLSPDGTTIYGHHSVVTSSDPYVDEEFLDVVDLNVVDWHPSVARIAGADRYAVSAAVSQAGFPAGAPVAYVVSGEVFPDALSTSTAAAEAGGPLLLSTRDGVPPTVLAELKRLQPATIVVVGGPASIGPAALTTLRGLGADVSVVSGADRYANSREIVARGWPEGASRLFIASGETFADALSASSAAHAVGAPLLVVHGSGSSLDAATMAAIRKTGASSFTVVGGPNTVTPGIADQLSRLGAVERLSGADRYETSAAVNAAVFDQPQTAYLASGAKFPDALSGGVLAAVNGAPIYVVQPSCVPRSIADHLAAVPAASVTLLGGEATLDQRAATLGIC